MTDFHDYVETLARRRIRSGYAGSDVIAGLLDLLEAARAGEQVRHDNFRLWCDAAGFGDNGPEVA